MPRTLALACLCALFALFPTAAQAIDTVTLRAKLAHETAHLGRSSGAYVRDLTTGRTLYTNRPDIALAPASNEKLFTTGTALLKLGPDATFRTSVLAGAQPVNGVLEGDIVLKGGGDPYLSTAQVQALAAQLVALGITTIHGRVIADATQLDSRVGSYDSGFGYDSDLGGRLSALGVGEGSGTDPALHAAQILHDALRHAHVQLAGLPRAGAAPAGALELAAVDSAPLSSLVASINVPSDNFGAELLLKDVGARAGTAGTTTAGAAVVRATLATLGIHPRVVDGSGLSRVDRTTPRQVARLLQLMSTQTVGPAFEASLPVAGRTGTLARRMRGTAAQDRCRAKTGTLTGVSALSGYCTLTTGSTVAFSFIENGVCSTCAKKIEDRMTTAVARYTG